MYNFKFLKLEEGEAHSVINVKLSQKMMAQYQQDQGSRGVLKSFQNVFITFPGGAICCVWLSCSFQAVINTSMSLSQQCLKGHGKDIILLNYYHAGCLEAPHVKTHSCLINVHHGKWDGILKTSVLQSVSCQNSFCWTEDSRRATFVTKQFSLIYM